MQRNAVEGGALHATLMQRTMQRRCKRGAFRSLYYKILMGWGAFPFFGAACLARYGR
jgi:hypothetical protein